MADGELRLELGEALSARLRAAADEAGVPPREFAERLIDRGLTDEWSIARARLAEYDRTGEFVEAEVAIAEFQDALGRALRAKRK